MTLIDIGAHASGYGDGDDDRLVQNVRVIRRYSGADPGLDRDVRCTRGSHDTRGGPGGGDARDDHVRCGARVDRRSRLCPSLEIEDVAVAPLVENSCRHGGRAQGAAGQTEKVAEVGRTCLDRIGCAYGREG